jgi:hypothetical protein
MYLTEVDPDGDFSNDLEDLAFERVRDGATLRDHRHASVGSIATTGDFTGGNHGQCWPGGHP